MNDQDDLQPELYEILFHKPIHKQMQKNNRNGHITIEMLVKDCNAKITTNNYYENVLYSEGITTSCNL